MLKTKVKPSSLFVPIDSIERRDDGYFVKGYAFVNEVVEGEGGIRIKRSAMEAATPEYMRFANIREMHQPIASGVATQALWTDRGCELEIKVVDPLAQKKCDEGVYKGLSVRVRPTVMRGNVVETLSWFETSLVDRPKDPDAVFSVFRAEGDEEGDADLLPEIKEVDGKFILRLEDDTFALYTTRELAEAAFVDRGIASGDPPIRENLEGKSKDLTPASYGDGAKCPQCGQLCRNCHPEAYRADAGRPTPDAGEVNDPNSGSPSLLTGVGRPASGVGLPSIERVIKEAEGGYCVFSHDGEKKLGGPYDTREEAENRLREVEHFKNKERVAGGPEALPAVLTDLYRLEDDYTIVLQRLTETEGVLARVQGEQEAATAALAEREKDLSRAKERIVTLENTPGPVPPVLTHGGNGTLERRFAANETGERLETRQRKELLVSRLEVLLPMRPAEPDEQRRVAQEIMALQGELNMLAAL
jgi:hypothetical protein